MHGEWFSLAYFAPGPVAGLLDVLFLTEIPAEGLGFLVAHALELSMRDQSWHAQTLDSTSLSLARRLILPKLAVVSGSPCEQTKVAGADLGPMVANGLESSPATIPTVDTTLSVSW